MILKLISIFFLIFSLLGMVPKTETGVVTASVLYYTSMSLCTMDTGTFAGFMSAGLATTTSIIYGTADDAILSGP
ncbi:unnamed protein product [Adineta ricciae]|uniref:Uncharacterized protein n=1 Tax=Adineta ricciae TaxID=249248 RepID=A0A815X409_ADIRI|nr:unnamed protein product [Adineta ricciae]CAF1552087.1 unnamed protein product [Adineta ricciae]